MPVLYQDKFRTASTRLPEWDYATPSAYFVTICTKGMRCCFGKVRNGEVILNKAGITAQENWLAIPSHYNNVVLDSFIIMPNHIHGILILSDPDLPTHQSVTVETLHATSLRAASKEFDSSFFSKISPKKGSLSAIIRSYKSSTTRMIRKQPNTDFAWQSRFYDHIIRTERDLENLRLYIALNPENRLLDSNETPSLEVLLHAC